MSAVQYSFIYHERDIYRCVRFYLGDNFGNLPKQVLLKVYKQAIVAVSLAQFMYSFKP